MQRFNCRGFLERPVGEDTIARLLAMAQRTPSWSNVQPWKLAITRGHATERFRDALYAESAKGGEGKSDFAPPSAYNGEYQVRRRECGFALYQAVGVTRGAGCLWCCRLRCLHRQFHARGAQLGRCEHCAGCPGPTCRLHPGGLWPAGRPHDHLQHIVRLRRPKPSSQQLPHQPIRLAKRSNAVVSVGARILHQRRSHHHDTSGHSSTNRAARSTEGSPMTSPP